MTDTASVTGSDEVTGVEQQYRLCLDNASDLVTAAQRVLGDGGDFPNIAYHLALLALEELGKGQLIISRAASGESVRVNRWLDDHVSKLMWAVWSPVLNGGRLDPKEFQEAKEFAQKSHERRLAGLYVDHSTEASNIPPRSVIALDQVENIVALAKVRLEYERATARSFVVEDNEELQWFTATVNDEYGRRRLFSAPFIQKHEELRGDTAAWVRWARDEFSKLEEEAAAHLKLEMDRAKPSPVDAKPKWLVKARVRTASHSIRQKAFSNWNAGSDYVKLRAGPKKDEVIVEMTMTDEIKLDEIVDASRGMLARFVVALNVGTTGFFWYEITSQAVVCFESLQDIQAPEMEVALSGGSSLRGIWPKDGGPSQRGPDALTPGHMFQAMKALIIFGPLPEKPASKIFAPYIQGVCVLAKSDIHLSLNEEARLAFANSIRGAMAHYGDWDGDEESLKPSFMAVFKGIIPEEGREQIFALLSLERTKTDLSDAVAAKRLTDLYLNIAIQREWPQILAKGKGDVTSPTTDSE